VIVLAGLPRCGTTWAHRVVYELTGRRIYNEPFDLWSVPRYSGLVSAAVYARPWLRPWWGEKPDWREESHKVCLLCRAFRRQYPQWGGIKTNCAPYWQAYRDEWPGCRLVYIRRAAVGRLVSWALMGWVDSNPTWQDVLRCSPRAVELWQGYLSRYRPEHEHLHLCALMLAVNEGYQLMYLPTDALVTDYERLTLDWGLEWRRVADYLQVPWPDLTVEQVSPYAPAGDDKAARLQASGYTYGETVLACEQAAEYLRGRWF
jgi:hypothetical protein